MVTPNVCPTSTITDIDGNLYNTVVIDNQCWMSENLKTSRYRNGGLILNVTDNTAWSNVLSNSTISGWSYNNNDEANNAIYGKLYNGYTTLGDTLCPSGWGVPTDAEWTILTDNLGGASVAGTLMKKNDALWTTNTGINTSGFSVLPGGYRNLDGSFINISGNAFFWSAAEIGSYGAWYRFLNNSNSNVNRNNYNKAVGASVRCLRD